MEQKLDMAALFQREKEENIRAMTQDKNTKRIGRLFMDHVTDYKYGYYFTWMGRPIIQHPQDIVALQEIIMEVQPDLIIETGIAHGGSLILSASLLELLDIVAPLDGVKREVVGIDIEIREHNRTAIEEMELYGPLVSVGSYLVVYDTLVEFEDKPHNDRPWKKGNSPYTAVQEFLHRHDEFVVDEKIEQKIVITSCPGGWLRREK